MSSGTFKQQMVEVRRQLNKRKRKDLKSPRPSPMSLVGDGVDHINIWEDAETELGMFLKHSSHFFFRHSIFGRFNTLENFWIYIHSVERDDQVRNMGLAAVRSFSRKLTKTHVTNFKAIIMDSNWQRIKQHPAYEQMLKESKLPIECYKVNQTENGTLLTRPPFYNWIIMGVEEIRSALKENREPDFTFLLDDPKSTIYQFAAQKLNSNEADVANTDSSDKEDDVFTGVVDEPELEPTITVEVSGDFTINNMEDLMQLKVSEILTVVDPQTT